MKKIEKTLEVVSLDDIRVNSKNWRRHSRKQRQMFQESLSEVGYITPVIWNKRTGNLIDGELRYTEVKQTGATEIECIVVDLPEDEEQKVLALLDQVTNGAQTDVDAYKVLVEAITFERDALNMELKLKFEEDRKAADRIGHAEYELTPEMLLEYDYVILVFKDSANALAAKDIFGVRPKTDRFNGKKGECRVINGDDWLASR